MTETSDSSGWIDVTDPRVVKAYAHPLRVRILEFLEGRIASPSEMATALGEPLSNISYHVRQLAGLGLVDLVRETRRRGAVEHHYEARFTPTITDATWARLPDIVKRAAIGGRLQHGMNELVAAVEDGGFDEPGSHYTHTAGRVDAHARDEIARELDRALARIDGIFAECEARVAGDPEAEAAAIRATVMLMHFSSSTAPPPAGLAAGLEQARARALAIASRTKNGETG